MKAYLSEEEVEKRLRSHPKLTEFWESPQPLLIVRSRPRRGDPLYEIQLAFDLGDRLETWRWIWVDALEGRIVRQFPP